MSENLMSQKLEAEISSLLAQTAKLNAETAKISKEAKWYETVVLIGFIIALLAAGKYLL